MDPLLSLYQSGRRLAFVCHAHDVLARVPEAPQLALLTLRALAELGLGGAARELIELRRDLPGDAAQREQLRRQLAELPHGRVSWDEQRDTFQRNLAALETHNPSLARRVAEAARGLDAMHLLRSTSGHFQLSQRQPGSLRRFGAPFSTLDDEPRVQLPPHGQLGPTVLLGPRSGNIVRCVFDRTHRLFLSYSHPVYVVERDIQRLAAWLHCDDLAGHLSQPRALLFAGEDALQQLEQALRAEPDLPLPLHFLDLGDGTRDAAEQCVRRVEQQRAQEVVAVQAELEARHAPRDERYWAQRWPTRGTVLAVTSRFTTVLQYSVRDALAALQDMGYRTRTVIERADHHRISPLTVLRAVRDTDPDFVLLLDHLRYEHPLMPASLPVIGWVQDPMPNLLCPQAGRSLTRLDFVCGYYRQRCVEEFGYPAERFLSVKIPVCRRRFHPGPAEADAMANLAADICFVSHASTPIERIYAEAVPAYPPLLHPLLELLYERITRLLADGGALDLETSARRLMLESMSAANLTMDEHDLDHIKTNFVWRLYDWGRRHQTLGWVADWARRTGRVLRIYGRGWQSHPALAEFAAGEAQHGEHLRQVYRSSRLALQLMPAGFLHQRSFEAIASGALPLTRWCPESDDFAGLTVEEYVERRARGEVLGGSASLMPGLEQVVFRTPAEFEQLAERYLGDTELLQRTWSAMYEVVRRDYSYDAVMSRVIEAFGQSLNGAAPSSS